MQLSALKHLDRMGQSLFWCRIYADVESASYDPVKASEFYNQFLQQLNSFLPEAETHKETIENIARLELEARKEVMKDDWKLRWLTPTSIFIDESNIL